MRIYELAKQLGVTNRDILDKLPGLGIVAKSHASSLSPEQSRTIVNIFKPEILEQTRAELQPIVAQKELKKAKPRVVAEEVRVARPQPQIQKPRKKEKRKRDMEQEQVGEISAPVEPVKPPITVREGITVKELAEKLGEETSSVIKSLIGVGVMATINQRITPDIAELIAAERGFTVRTEELFKAAELESQAPEVVTDAIPRPPVVTVMGHVDHGKTLLLDYIRKSNVVAGEAGGITQHIGAYSVETPGGAITFIDTPGHEAFTAMRARGASVTDIVVLVVASDDGIMPQTEEAIHHAQAAGVPIIVAINKCDLPTANIQRVLTQLSERNLAPEEWGGKTIVVETSAKTGKNVDRLLEMILLQAEVLELKATASGRAKGVVIESRLDKGQGVIVTVLIQQGRLDVGSSFVCGASSGRVRALLKSDGGRIQSATPGRSAAVLGFNSMPAVGDVLIGAANEREARRIADERASVERAEQLEKPLVLATLEDLQKQLAGETVKELAIVIKADAAGSVEALRDAVDRIRDERVALRVLHGAVGAVTDTDVNLAAASHGLIVAFNVRAVPSATQIAKRLGVEIRHYDIIYKLVDDVTKALEGLLDPEIKETVLGHVEVRETFKVSKIGTIAGSYVVDGQVKRNALVRLTRDGAIVYTGKIGSLRRFKDDVKEVGVNYECGIGIENFNDVKVGDVIEVFMVTEKTRTLSGS